MGYNDMNPFDVYAVRRPARNDWSFERTTFLPNGGVSTEVVRLEQCTYQEACKERDAYNAPNVVCGVLYKV